MADEYIRRDDAIKIAERYGLSNGSVLGRHTGLADCIASEISCLPAADVAPVVHGWWVVRFDGPYKRRRCYCSHCGKHNGVGGIAQNQEKPYCPNCGARMDGGKENAAD